MLNPDTRVEPDAMERAVGHLDADPAWSAVTAWLIGEAGQLQRYYRRLPRLRDVPVALIPRLLDWTPMARRYRMADVAFDAPTPVEQPPGAFILIRRSACPEPLLDPGYLNFFSDVELCRTLADRGLIRMEPDVRCFHVRGGAGLVTHDPAERARLHQDLVCGVRRYFRAEGSRSRMGRGLGARLLGHPDRSDGVTVGRVHALSGWAAARASLAGRPPDYDGGAAS